MDTFRMRRSSFSRFGSVGKQEPLIVVEESQLVEEEDRDSSETPSNKASLDIDSPVNPYLLSPWRDPREGRKHSLPSQQVTEGITASQVRRLSERGGEGSGPSPKEAAFLATLSQAPAPSGRRHSVVTISKVPTTLFGRSRRESVAAYPAGSSRVLNSRRESKTSTGPPSTDPIGSIHNLQLDIMDDIVQSRKARMKLWNTSSEKVCEVQTLDEVGGGTPQRYTNRRYSECVSGGTSPAPNMRRASEHPAIISPCILQPGSNRSSTKRKKSGGLLSTSIFSALTSSAIEINKCEDTIPTVVLPSSTSASSTGATAKTKPTTSGGLTATGGAAATSSSSSNLLDPNAGRSTRSNSFDVSILNNAKQLVSNAQDNSSAALSGWFEKRHQPMARKKSIRSKSTAMALSEDMLKRLQAKDVLRESKPKLVPRSKQKSWADTTKGTIVDATVIGSAIEGFLRKGSVSGPSGSSGSSPKTSNTKSSGLLSKDSGKRSGRSAQSQATNAVRSTLNWFGKADEDDSKDTCEASLCSTLKDLFVK
ncbi:uncharacterized protein LOC105223632 [Bactrocera dorsalis]|uniref:Uncharacterized protein LOC105223632 n=1 Tax=Bactrocera dorsalis TaxID=27457 RepID=A0ABM3JMP9_BACDO|nr:uncharacterized protein LOC105223632 [Bactrocera dorsalis]XP_049310487.1 uncharacterized protein LOC105223632 [Bactrocera dorsalis]